MIAFGLAVALAAVAGYAAGSAVTPSSATALKDVGSPKNKLALISIAPYDCEAPRGTPARLGARGRSASEPRRRRAYAGPNDSYDDEYMPECSGDPNLVKVGIDTLCEDESKNLNNCPYRDDNSFWSVRVAASKWRRRDAKHSERTRRETLGMAPTR